MESTKRTDRMLHANVEAFAAALEAGREKVDKPEWPELVMAVLDGSNQDSTSLALLTALARHCACKALVTPGVFTAGTSADEDAALAGALDELAGGGITAEGVVSDRAESHERILQVIERRGPGLCILPCPFSHDFQELGATTLGTVVEVVLAKSEIPVLVTRGEVSDRPHLIAYDADAATAHATRLALGLLACNGEPRGDLQITFIFNGEPDSEVGDVIALGFEAGAETLIPYLSKGLSSYLHRLTDMADTNPELRIAARLVRAGGQLADAPEVTRCIHVLAMEGDATAVGIRVHDLVLGTRGPVLVVPS